MELYLIRHAQSANNACPESLRVADPPLTELGREQAHLLASTLADVGLTRLITSPFLRTLETAEILRATTGLVPEVRVQLHEQGGCYSGHLPLARVGQPGLNRAEIQQRFPHRLRGIFSRGERASSTGSDASNREVDVWTQRGIGVRLLDSPSDYGCHTGLAETLVL